MTLSSAAGVEVDIVTVGAALQGIRVPVNGRKLAVVLGYADAAGYLSDAHAMGATVGRYAGRIGGGSFELRGQTIQLDTGGGKHCLHGGPSGLHTRSWTLRSRAGADRATFDCLSSDGDQGFPGELSASVAYSLDECRLTMDLSAESTHDTVVNLTNHAYFNLAGGGTIEKHQLTVFADHYLATDDEGIPTGELLSVDETPMDFRRPAYLGERIEQQAGGFDHTYVLAPHDGPSLNVNGQRLPLAASASSDDSGLVLNVYTSQPGLQLYTGQHLAEPFAPLQGFCLEAQAFPDSPNQSAFPSTVLRAGNRYQQYIVYEFLHPEQNIGGKSA